MQCPKDGLDYSPFASGASYQSSQSSFAVVLEPGTSLSLQLSARIVHCHGNQESQHHRVHPQTDGLVELFNRNLTDMLAKTTEKGGPDWDPCLSYVLFTYHASMQSSTMASPFFLLYERDPSLPTETALTAPVIRSEVDLVTYKEEVVQSLTEAWGLAQSHVRKAQDKQKRLHDQRAAEPSFRFGDRVFLYEPAAKSSKAHKFARPYIGPYRIVCLYQNGAEVHPVDKPQKAAIQVALNRLRQCPAEVADHSKGPVDALVAQATNDPMPPMGDSVSRLDSVETTAWAGRLRLRQKPDGDARHKNREM